MIETTKRMPVRPKGGKRPSLLISAASNWFVLIVNAVAGFFLTPYIIHHIGRQGYGIWVLVYSFVGYYSLLRMGVGTAIMRYISLNDGRGDNRAVSGTFSTAMFMYTVVGLVIIGVSVMCGNLLASFFHQGDNFARLIILIGISAAIACPAAVLEAALRSREFFVPANFTGIITAAARCAALAVVLLCGCHLMGMAAVSIAVSAGELVLMAAVFRHYCPDIHIRIGLIKAIHAKELLAFGFMVTLVSLGMTLRFDTDRAVIGRVISMEMLGTYAVVATLLMTYRNIMRATTRVLNPRFSFLDGLRDKEASITLFLRSTRFTSLLAGYISIMLVLIGPSFIRLWVGHGFEAAYRALIILAMAHLVGQSQCATYAFLNGVGKQAAMAVFTIIEGVVSVGLSIFLGARYGLTGIAVGIAIPMVIMNLFAYSLYTCNYLELKTMRYIRTCLIPPWFTALAFIGIGKLTVPYSFSSHWPGFLVCTFLYSAFFMFISYCFLLDKNERGGIITVVRKTPVLRKIAASRAFSGALKALERTGAMRD
jgi:O-antigen/teichoic acid export membrane protein